MPSTKSTHKQWMLWNVSTAQSHDSQALSHHNVSIYPVAEAISAINSAVTLDDPSATMEALKGPPAEIRSITDECVETYVEKLAAARQEKVDTGRGGCTYQGRSVGWVCFN